MSGASTTIADHRISQQIDGVAQTAEVDLRIWSAIQYLFVGAVLAVARLLPGPGLAIGAVCSITCTCIYTKMLEHKAAWKEREITRIVREYVDLGYDPDEISVAFQKDVSNPERQAVLQRARWQFVVSKAHFVALPAMLLVSHFWVTMAIAVALGAAETVVRNKLKKADKESFTTAQQLALSMANIKQVVERELAYIRILGGPISTTESESSEEASVSGKKEEIPPDHKSERLIEIEKSLCRIEAQLSTAPPLPDDSFEPFTPLRDHRVVPLSADNPLKRLQKQQPGTPLSPIPFCLSPMLNRSIRAEVHEAFSALERSKATLLEADSEKLEELGHAVAGLQAQFSQREHHPEVEKERATLHASIAMLHQSILKAKDEGDPKQREQILQDIQTHLHELPVRFAAYRDLLDSSVVSVEESYLEKSFLRMDAIAESIEMLKANRDEGMDKAILAKLDEMYRQLNQFVNSHQEAKLPAISDRTEQLLQLCSEQTEWLRGLQEQLQKLSGSEETHRLVQDLQDEVRELRHAENIPSQEALATKILREQLAAIFEAISSLEKRLEPHRETTRGGDRDAILLDQSFRTEVNQALATLDRSRATILEADKGKLEELNQTVEGLQAQLSIRHSNSAVEHERSALRTSLIQLQESICLAKNAENPQEQREILLAIQNTLDQMPARFAEYRRVLDHSVVSFDQSVESIDELLRELQKSTDEEVDQEALKSLTAMHEQLQEASFSESPEPGSAKSTSDRTEGLIVPPTERTDLLGRMQNALQKVTGRANEGSEKTQNLVLALQVHIDKLRIVGGGYPHTRSTSLERQLVQFRSDLQLSLEQLFRFIQEKEHERFSQFEEAVKGIREIMVQNEGRDASRLEPTESSESGKLETIESQLATVLSLVQNSSAPSGAQIAELKSVVEALKQEVVELKASTRLANPQLEAIVALHPPERPREITELKQEIQYLSTAVKTFLDAVQHRISVEAPVHAAEKSAMVEEQLAEVQQLLSVPAEDFGAQRKNIAAVNAKLKVNPELAELKEAVGILQQRETSGEVAQLQEQVTNLSSKLMNFLEMHDAQRAGSEIPVPVSEESSKVARQLAQVQQSLAMLAEDSETHRRAITAVDETLKTTPQLAEIKEAVATHRHEETSEKIAELQEQVSSLRTYMQTFAESHESQVIPAGAIEHLSEESSRVAEQLAQIQQSLLSFAKYSEAQQRALAAIHEKLEATPQFAEIKEAVAALQQQRGSGEVVKLQQQVNTLHTALYTFIESHEAQSISPKALERISEKSSRVEEQLNQVQQSLLSFAKYSEAQQRALAAIHEKLEATPQFADIKEAIASLQQQRGSEEVVKLQKQVNTLHTALYAFLESHESQVIPAGALERISEESSRVEEQLAQIQQSLLSFAEGAEAQRRDMTTVSEKLETSPQFAKIKEAIAAHRHEETSEKIAELQEQVNSLRITLQAFVESQVAVTEDSAARQSDIASLSEKLRRVTTSLTGYITTNGEQFESLSEQLTTVAKESWEMKALVGELKSAEMEERVEIKGEISRLSAAVSANTEALEAIPQAYASQLLKIQSSIDELRTEERFMEVTEGFQKRLGRLESQLDAVLNVKPSNKEQTKAGNSLVEQVVDQLDALDNVVTSTVAVVNKAKKPEILTDNSVVSKANHGEKPTYNPVTKQELKKRRHTVSTGLATQLAAACSEQTLPKPDHRRLSRVVEIISSIPQRAHIEIRGQESHQIKVLEQQHALTAEFLKRMNQSIDQGVEYDLNPLRTVYKNQVFYARFWKTTYFSTFTILKGLPLYQPDACEDGHEADSMKEEDLHGGIRALMPEIIEWKGALDVLLASEEQKE